MNLITLYLNEKKKVKDTAYLGQEIKEYMGSS